MPEMRSVDKLWIIGHSLQLHLSGEKERYGGSNPRPLERRELSLQKRRRLFETVNG